MLAKKASFAAPRSIVELAYVTGWSLEEITELDLGVFDLFYAAAADLMKDLHKQ